MADGVDTSVDSVQSPDLGSVLNRPSPETQLDQLPVRDNSVLVRCEVRHRSVTLAL